MSSIWKGWGRENSAFRRPNIARNFSHSTHSPDTRVIIRGRHPSGRATPAGDPFPSETSNSPLQGMKKLGNFMQEKQEHHLLCWTETI